MPSILERFNQLLTERSGIHFSDSSLRVLQQRISAKVSHLKLQSPQEYYDLLRFDSVMFEQFLDFVTTNFSYFYRESYHYDVLKRQVIEQIQQCGKSKVRIWSAGCSTGEEPYTLAMLFAQLAPGIQLEIVATDISRTCIQIAKQGIYPEGRLSKLPKELRDSYMQQLNRPDIEQIIRENKAPLVLEKGNAMHSDLRNCNERLWQVNRSILTQVDFSYYNLSSPSYREFVSSKFDIIFCRNVLIYFSPAIQEHVVNQFSDVLADDGWLFLGHADHISNMQTRFVYSEATCYFLPTRTHPAVESRSPR